MIQIYAPGNTNFDRNGDMPILPATADIHAILNSSWEATMTHPIDPEGRWKRIVEGAVVKMPSFLQDDQLFRIKRVSKDETSVEVTMDPIFFDSAGDCFLVDVRPTSKTGQQALDIMTAPNTKYSGTSNITKAATAYYQYKNLMEAINGDDENSFINRWGGEILFDNFTIRINDRVGGDYGLELRYGKNIPVNGFEYEADISEVITRIYPKAYNGYTMNGSGYVDSPLIGNYPTVKAATITFDDIKMAEDALEDDEENGVIICNTQEELNIALAQKCNDQYTAGIDKPKVTISADMVLLKDTEQYKDYTVLEDVSLGDTITCTHSLLGVSAEARVIELHYDPIYKKVSSVEIGDFQYNYFNNVDSSVSRIDKAIRPNGTIIAEQVAGFINGALASLRAQYDIAQKLDVISVLFENLDEESPLYGAMALGTQGLMISKTRTSDGRDWDWTTAMTANGMIGNIIVAGILSDKLGKNFWNLDTGEFSLSADSFYVGDETAESYFKGSISQEDVFNKLTNNGQVQGIYMQNGQLYFNFSYAKGGTLSLGGPSNGNGTLEVRNQSNQVTAYIGSEGIYSYASSQYEEALTIEDGTLAFYYDTGGSQREMLASMGAARVIDDTTIGSLKFKAQIFTFDLMDQGISSGIGMLRMDEDQFYVTRSVLIQDYTDVNILANVLRADSNGVDIYTELTVSGPKNRLVKTSNYGKRLQYCYETATPYFGDIGTGKLNEDGECYVSIDSIFSETIESNVEYIVFLQAEGKGEIWVESKDPDFFVAKGTPGLKFAWEIKAMQKDYSQHRLDDFDLGRSFNIPWDNDLEKISNEMLAEYDRNIKALEESYTENIAEYDKEVEEMNL